LQFQQLIIIKIIQHANDCCISLLTTCSAANNMAARSNQQQKVATPAGSSVDISLMPQAVCVC